MEIRNLRAYLSNVGMTVRAFSELVDCDPKYISRIAVGRIIPGRRLARDIFNATGGVINFEKCQKREKSTKAIKNEEVHKNTTM